MIRNKASADTSPIDGQIAMLKDHAKLVEAAGQRAYDKIAPQALEELRREPGPVKQPVQWTSDDQRIAVMIKYREQGIEKYERSHKLSQSWTFIVFTEGRIFKAVMENPAPQAKFVYGSMAQNRVAALRFKQIMHSNTGWQDITDTATKWTRALLDAFREEYKLEVQVRRRAYTKGSRKKR
jgi:hypothetical protein